MKKSSFIFLTFLSLLLILNTINAIEFTSFDYKNEYLEPGKTYDLWVVITPEKEINNTIIGIYPYGISKEYIQIIKGKDYVGHLFQSEQGVGHFIIKIKDNAPSKDYKIVAYCNYTENGEQYSENRIFEIPVRGEAIIEIQNPPILKEGTNKIFLRITNKGTGIAENIKITFENGKNIYALSNSYVINYLKPGETKLIRLILYANGEIGELPYTITYQNQYNLLELTDKTETDTSTTSTYKNQKTIEEKGTLTFKIVPNDLISINLKNITCPVGKINNLTILIRNNYKDANFIITIGKYYLGNNQKTIFIKKGETKNVSFKIKINEMGIKEIPIKIYFDENEINKNLTINVIGKAELVLTGVNVEGFGEKIITGDLSNIGTAPAKSVLISIKKTKNIIPKRPYENYFIGTLNPDDYGSFELHCQINGTVNEIPIVITYRDENNNLVTIYKTIKINGDVISLKNNNKEEVNYLVIGIAIVFCFGVVYLIYRGFVRKDEK
ncbi:COG1361 S-layer family protein [Methanotorris igneus]|uniref:CARDB domain-containing protein n=1 Tax=Methanotorris igneus (strain DSM 5666 / JCM 11834 / Kol 5) TaxID=880724 RepID=F6BDP9_METIK|nr:COG1361 S-layer family protein [Methanotorris igneus]AEF96610.1 hypothetical protein Metig_1071 [Methanotorris igneus Kol 5]